MMSDLLIRVVFAILCMARQKEISSSLGGNEIGSCNSCGQRQRLATSFRGETWKEKQKSFLRVHEQMQGTRRTVESKTVYVLEFKRTSDQRQDYREQGEHRGLAQHDVLVQSLDTVAKGWSNRNETQSGEDSCMSC